MAPPSPVQLGYGPAGQPTSNDHTSTETSSRIHSTESYVVQATSFEFRVSTGFKPLPTSKSDVDQVVVFFLCRVEPSERIEPRKDPTHIYRLV